jgi:hypothetical protein
MLFLHLLLHLILIFDSINYESSLQVAYLLWILYYQRSSWRLSEDALSFAHVCCW